MSKQLTAFEIELRSTIQNNLKRITKGCTQRQISDKTGIPQSTISGYFAQRSLPTAGNLEKLAEAFNVKKSDIDPRYSDEGFSFDNQSEYTAYDELTLDELRESLTPLTSKGRAIGRGFENLDKSKQDLFEKLLLEMQNDDPEDD